MNFLTNVTASFAQPAAENPTVVMMEAAYQHHKLPYRYINLEVPPDRLADAVHGARAMGFAGFNCSLPHKVAVIELLDGLGESAAVMGAVNCVVQREGQLIGENTDGKGFVESLRGVTSPEGKRVVMFGAGGAARAIGTELALAGAKKITVVNRSPERGEELASLLQDKAKIPTDLVAWEGDFSVPEETEVVINATSIGLHPDVDARVAVDLDSIVSTMVVADVIPNPPRTRLIRDAEAKGCPVLDGLGMLVNQGILGIQYWTGTKADGGVMRAALEKVFGG